MGHVDTRTIEQAIAALRDTVSRLEQTLPSVPPDAREDLIKTLVAYDERVDELERASGIRYAGTDASQCATLRP